MACIISFSHFHFIPSAFLLLHLFSCAPATSIGRSPHIIFILADDLGWNDVSYHGSPQIPTGNIDALAWNGLRLTQYYTQPICSPSRSALMTGLYPIHTGMQNFVIDNREGRGLPLGLKLLPEWLADLGYTNYLVGKWHLGFYKKEYTPTRRGFHHHFGFWGSHVDYFNHTASYPKNPGPFELDKDDTDTASMEWLTGLDYRSGFHPLWNYTGQYSTDVLTSEAVRVIENHPVERPMFLYLAHGAPHAGDVHEPLQAPDDYTTGFQDIGHEDRIKYAGMVKALDISVGEVFRALKNKGMLENSVIVFSSDNGPDLERIISNYATAWPLRGQKETPWEGGVKSPALIWSPLLNLPSRATYDGLVHITDWLPTFYHLAGGADSDLGQIDGVDNWNAFLNQEQPQRNELLINIDPEEDYAAIRDGNFKLIIGDFGDGTYNRWYPIYGNVSWDSRKPRDACETSVVSRIIAETGRPTVCGLDASSYATPIQCGVRQSNESCDSIKNPCLFDLSVDPCEYNNLAEHHPEIVERLRAKISQYRSTSLPPANRPSDARSDPDLHGGLWTTWAESASPQEGTPQSPTASQKSVFSMLMSFVNTLMDVASYAFGERPSIQNLVG